MSQSPSTYTPNTPIEFSRLALQAENTRKADIHAVIYALSRIKKDRLAILDVGCAYGFVTVDRFAAIPNALVVGIDVNTQCLQYANSHNRPDNFAYEQVDLESPTLEKDLSVILEKYNLDHFDIIFSSLVLHHLNNPVELLKKLKPFLAKDGYIILRGSDDGSAIASDSNDLIQRITDLHTSTEGVSDRFNGRKLYPQLLSAGYNNIKMMNSFKETSRMTAEEKMDVFEERFSYKSQYLKRAHESDPSDKEKLNKLLEMERCLNELKERFKDEGFWYSETDFVAIAQPD